MRCGYDTNNYVFLPSVTHHCVAFIRRTFLIFFSKFGRGWKVPCGKLRIRYELLRSLRMRYVSLRNERIVADRLYVPSAESVSVCVTGASQT